MNDTLKTIFNRRSIRSFEEKQINDEDLSLIIAAGKAAPTALNSQTWHFTVIQDQTILNDISRINRNILLNCGVKAIEERAKDENFSNFYHAPTVIIISDEEGDYADVNTANAAENICLAAESLGLGSCYIASFRPALQSSNGADLRRLLKLPAGQSPKWAVALGYIKGSTPAAPACLYNNVTLLK